MSTTTATRTTTGLRTRGMVCARFLKTPMRVRPVGVTGKGEVILAKAKY